MVSLGQKLKMQKTCEKPFHKTIKVLLCKKPLEKIPNIREMGQVRKSVILQGPVSYTHLTLPTTPYV